MQTITRLPPSLLLYLYLTLVIPLEPIKGLALAFVPVLRDHVTLQEAQLADNLSRLSSCRILCRNCRICRLLQP